MQIETGWLLASVGTIIASMWGALGVMAKMLSNSYEARIRDKDERLKDKDELNDTLWDLVGDLRGTARSAVETGRAAVTTLERRTNRR